MKYTILKLRYIDDSNDSIINETNNVDEINQMINEYINSLNFKSYYWRTSIFTEDNSYVIDYGSYSDFVKIVCDTKESFQTYLENK